MVQDFHRYTHVVEHVLMHHALVLSSAVSGVSSRGRLCSGEGVSLAVLTPGEALDVAYVARALSEVKDVQIETIGHVPNVIDYRDFSELEYERLVAGEVEEWDCVDGVAVAEVVGVVHPAFHHLGSGV